MNDTILSDYPRSVASDGRVVSIRTLNSFCHSSATVVNRIGTRGATTRYYREQYTLNIETTSAEQVIFDSDSSVTVSKRILDFILKHTSLSPDARILDVGCGRGLLLTEFARHSDTYNMAGIEPNQTAMTLLENELKLSPLELYQDLSDDRLEDNYDLVLLTNVIEHVEDPQSFLKQVVRLLKPGASLFVGAPNFTTNPLDLLIADHLTRYTPYTILALSVSAGLTLLASDISNDSVPMWYLFTKPALPLEPRGHCSELGDTHTVREQAIAEENQHWLDMCLDRTANEITDAKSQGIPIILYGTGSLWPGLLALNSCLETDIDYIVDDNPSYWNTKRWNHSIQQPYKVYTHLESSSLSVVCSNPCYSARITDTIASLSRGRSTITGSCIPLTRF